MDFVLTATYRCLPGHTDTVLGHLEEMALHSRAEPGCLDYRVHRSTEDPSVILLYERYVDESAYSAHTASEHFEKIVKGRIVPLLEQRERAFFATVDV